MSLFADRLRQLHIVAWLEGISYLLLLFIAMPLKYFADMPEYVRSIGMAHGLLFVLFTYLAVMAKVEHDWSMPRLTRVWLTSLVPFGMLAVGRMSHTGERPYAAR